MEKNKNFMYLQNHKNEIAETLAIIIEDSCKNLDLRCLDWFCYTPEFFISMKEKKAA